jgi:hypothetical protein
MLHAGAQAMDRNALELLPAPMPLGPRHCPMPFIEDVRLVTQQLAQNGLEVTNEAFGVTLVDGLPARFFGVMELVSTRTSHALVVGLRGSYDQSISRGLAVGSRVFVCDNLAFSGEVTYHTKQTTYIGDRLPRMIADAAMRVPALAAHQEMRFDKYRMTALKPRHGDAAMVELLRLGVLNGHTLPRAVAEWDEPSHPEHAEDGFSAWRLMNAVTESIKARDPEKPNVLPVWDRTLKLTKFLDEVAGL